MDPRDSSGTDKINYIFYHTEFDILNSMELLDFHKKIVITKLLSRPIKPKTQLFTQTWKTQKGDLKTQKKDPTKKNLTF